MFAISIMLCIAAAVFLFLGRAVALLPLEFGVKGDTIVFASVLGVIGAIIAIRQPGNAIGWIFCGLGIVSGTMAFSAAYARWAVIGEAGRPVAGLYAAWLQEWLWILLAIGLGAVALIFPDGRFLSGRWRVATWIAVAAASLATVANALVPHLSIYVGHDNPVGIGGEGMQRLALASVSVGALPVLLLGMASVVVRFRRSDGEERLQLKWLMLAIIALAAMLTFYATESLVAGTGGRSLAEEDWLEYLAILAFLSIPVSIAFGVLKYRLYDIDVVISKTVVYGAMAVFVTIVYVAIVVGVGTAVGTTGDAALSAVAAAIVALAFQPVRRRAQRLANRLVYGERATPYEVLADLGDRLSGEYAVENVVTRVASTLAGGVGAERVTVWLEVGQELRPVGAWPSGTGAPALRLDGDAIPDTADGLRVFPVHHQGELLGAMGVARPADPCLRPTRS